MFSVYLFLIKPVEFKKLSKLKTNSFSQTLFNLEDYSKQLGQEKFFLFKIFSSNAQLTWMVGGQKMSQLLLLKRLEDTEKKIWFV